MPKHLIYIFDMWWHVFFFWIDIIVCSKRESYIYKIIHAFFYSHFIEASKLSGWNCAIMMCDNCSSEWSTCSVSIELEKVHHMIDQVNSHRRSSITLNAIMWVLLFCASHMRIITASVKQWIIRSQIKIPLLQSSFLWKFLRDTNWAIEICNMDFWWHITVRDEEIF